MLTREEQKIIEITSNDLATPLFMRLFSELCAEKATIDYQDSKDKKGFFETKEQHNIKLIKSLIANPLYVDRVSFFYKIEGKEKEILSQDEIKNEALIIKEKINDKTISEADIKQINIGNKLFKLYLEEMKKRATKIAEEQLQNMLNRRKQFENHYTPSLEHDLLLSELKSIEKTLNETEYEDYLKFISGQFKQYNVECFAQNVRPEIRLAFVTDFFKKKLFVGLREYAEEEASHAKTILGLYLATSKKRIEKMAEDYFNEIKQQSSHADVAWCDEELNRAKTYLSLAGQIKKIFQKYNVIINLFVLTRALFLLEEKKKEKDEIQKKFSTYLHETEQLVIALTRVSLVSLKDEEVIQKIYFSYEKEYNKLEKLLSENTALLDNNLFEKKQYENGLSQANKNLKELKFSVDINIARMKREKTVIAPTPSPVFVANQNQSVPKVPSLVLPRTLLVTGALVLAVGIIVSATVLGWVFGAMLGAFGIWLMLEGNKKNNELKISYQEALNAYYLNHSELKPIAHIEKEILPIEYLQLNRSRIEVKGAQGALNNQISETKSCLKP